MASRKSLPLDAQPQDGDVLNAVTKIYKRLKRSREHDDSIRFEGSDSQEDSASSVDRVTTAEEDQQLDDETRDDLRTMMFFLSQARKSADKPATSPAPSSPLAESVIYHTLESSGAKHRRHCKVCHKLTVMRCSHCHETPHLCEGSCALKFHNPKLHIISN